jgi:hypothetical protein
MCLSHNQRGTVSLDSSVTSFACVCLCQLEAHGALVVQLKQEIARQSQLNAAQCRAWSEQNEVGRGSRGRVLWT